MYPQHYIVPYIQVEKGNNFIIGESIQKRKFRFNLFFTENVHMQFRSPKQIWFQHAGSLVGYVYFSQIRSTLRQYLQNWPRN